MLTHKDTLKRFAFDYLLVYTSSFIAFVICNLLILRWALPESEYEKSELNLLALY